MTFVTNGKLKTHIIVKHTDPADRPNFSCTFCDRTFYIKTSLTLHTTTHTGERKLKCDIGNCTKAFAERWTLEKHLRTHLDKKPFACTLCEANFAQKHQLKNHMKNKHSAT